LGKSPLLSLESEGDFFDWEFVILVLNFFWMNQTMMQDVPCENKNVCAK